MQGVYMSAKVTCGARGCYEAVEVTKKEANMILVPNGRRAPTCPGCEYDQSDEVVGESKTIKASELLDQQ